MEKIKVDILDDDSITKNQGPNDPSTVGDVSTTKA